MGARHDKTMSTEDVQGFSGFYGNGAEALLQTQNLAVSRSAFIEAYVFVAHAARQQMRSLLLPCAKCPLVWISGRRLFDCSLSRGGGHSARR